jgi:mRNA deadenylase 3'-5' endonuclease subunit Ccr4
MIGDLVAEGLSKIFQDDKKGEDDDDDDEEEDDEEETDEVQTAENGDSKKLSHENNRTLSVAGNIQRRMETGNLAT